MRKITLNTIAIIILLIACNKPEKNTKDYIVGNWASGDGAKISFTISGNFRASAFPREYFSFPKSNGAMESISMNGSGSWRLVSGEQFEEIKLSFDTINTESVLGMYSLYVESGWFFTDPKPKYIFLWADEPGGTRYKFHKVK